ncbi:MAG TPA: DNA-directed RNA polymerase subunit omega [Clostridiaceae bacterium]|jgi:DNA-directed RNA polymerase subunit omega|nr:DNA-directed RNA polymerase subunit omega [Clostridiaceae bacterium]
MLYPPLSELLNKVDTRYTLVVATAKRARQLVDGAQRLVEVNSESPVTVAIEEIKKGKIRYYRKNKPGIK